MTNTKKFSDVFNKIRYAKLELKHDKPQLEFDQQVKHAKKRSMTEDVEQVVNEEYTQEQIEEAIDHIITARQIIGHSRTDKSGSHEYMKFLNQLRDKFGKEYSTNVHKTATKLAMEEVEQLDEISKELAGKYLHKVTSNQVKKQGIQPNMYDKLPAKRQKGVDNAFKRLLTKEEVEQIDEISKSTLDSYIHKSFAAGNELHKQIEKETDPSKKAELRAKLSKRNTGVITSAKKLRGEEVEQIDEVSLDTARDVHKVRFNNWEKAKKSGDKEAIQKTQDKMVKSFRHVRVKDSKEMKKITDQLPKTPEGIAKMHNDKYEHDKAKGWSTESVEISDENLMLEVISSQSSNKTHEGQFTEKEHGKHFTYKNTNNLWAKKHNLPHEIDVHDGVRYGHVKGTVAHVATDENDDGTPKIQKWNIKNHVKWMKESRTTDIVKDTYKKAKDKKKDLKNDKDVLGKVEKFEADPQLTDTLQKQ